MQDRRIGRASSYSPPDHPLYNPFLALASEGFLPGVGSSVPKWAIVPSLANIPVMNRIRITPVVLDSSVKLITGARVTGSSNISWGQNCRYGLYGPSKALLADSGNIENQVTTLDATHGILNLPFSAPVAISTGGVHYFVLIAGNTSLSLGATANTLNQPFHVDTLNVEFNPGGSWIPLPATLTVDGTPLAVYNVLFVELY